MAFEETINKGNKSFQAKRFVFVINLVLINGYIYLNLTEGKRCIEIP